MSLSILLISDQMIKDRTPIHGNIDPQLLHTDIKVAQDMYIHPILGTALYNKLLSDIDGSGPTGVYKSLIDNFIVDTLIWYTMADLPTTLSYQFWNKGVLRKQGENTETPSMSELIDLSNRARNRAEFYANRLRLYLKQNSTTYPEYLNPGSGVDDIQPENKSFTMPIFLGDNTNCGKSLEEKHQGNNPNCC